MKKKYTEDDVLRYIYGEMTQDESDSFLDALCTDDELLALYEKLSEAKSELPPIELSPSQTSVNKIMYMARAATTNVRSVREPAGREKSGRLMKYQHLISVGMVFFTCLLIGVAMLIFQHETGDKNSWNMTNTASDFHDDELDQRLDFAKERLQNIMDNKLDAPLPVHHDIYREVNLDLSSPQSSEVVFLNIK